ncbi:endoplasmic reticulum protein [Kwoniella mangroviensis CBS 8886]|uniref:uncharacterized protein n=1 Tax=Kwoniella mangroviensis CBS 8507 TaxID=1296122 RepID=UPI00080D0B3D|nr:endoplasmic reticulum protein [Kwoniella mangroviensis CBS 8507]OCF64037.1 endoplasmic reticulum protein [Kwoniella mangroviensis CBS 8507]OCF73784.1 endoplasmic reticulum protein [Kwoniella mangroviensis CBS 8886]
MSFIKASTPISLSIRSTLRATPRPLLSSVRPISSTPVSRMVVSPFLYEARKTSRSAWAKDPIVKYEELKPITQQPTDDILIVDVREPDEVALGSIPSAVNLPLSRLKDALDKGFNPGDFQKEFAFSKPTYDQNIIFFCRSGKRSANAAELAGEKGYGNVRNYVGSWLDWSKREGEDKDD